jgi:hypothetical protein
MTGETEMLARIKAIAAAASPVDRALCRVTHEWCSLSARF